jgi:hypothetical protein
MVRVPAGVETTMPGWIRLVIVFGAAGVLATLGACDNSPTAPPPPLELTGTWAGQLGQPGSTTALRLTWEAMQSGNSMGGVATMVKPAFNVQARGAMSAIVQGDRLLITYVVFPDTVPGFPRCEIAGFGNATATNNRIAGALPLMFRNCDGSGLEAPGSSELVFTK